MKRLICIFTAVLSAGFAEAQFSDFGVTVSSDGTLTYPAAAEFRSKNDIAAKSDIPQIKTLTLGDGLLGTSYNGSAAVSTGIDISWLLQKRKCFDRDIRLYVDMTPTVDVFHKNLDGSYNTYYWTDCEIKAIDNRTNAIIYFTSTIALNNSQVAQLHPDITDKAIRVWYRTVYGGSDCYGGIYEFVDFDSCIGYDADNKAPITGVWVYPNLEKNIKWNNKNVSVREILTHPDVTVLAWRQTPTRGELYNSQKVWRPVRVERYGEMHQVPNYIPQNNAFVGKIDNFTQVGIYQHTENGDCPLYYLNDQLTFVAGNACPYDYVLYFRYGTNFSKQSNRRLVLEFESDTATWNTKSTAARTITITGGTGKGTVLWTKPENSNTATSARKFYLALDGGSSSVSISGPFIKGEIFRMPKFRTYFEE